MDEAQKRPVLHRIDEFRDVLQHYEISEHAEQVLHATNFVALIGLAGGGRNTVIRQLVAKHNYFYIISDTTRPPKFRDGKTEQNGVEYFFRNEDALLDDLKNGEFLEAELIHGQQVSGVSIRELSRASEQGQVAITDMEYGGAQNVAKAKPDSHIIGILPPNHEEWLRRLHQRETLHDEEFLNRLRTAEKVLNTMLSQPYVQLVVNDDIDKCVGIIRDIVEHHRHDPDERDRAIVVARDILDYVQTELAKVA